MIVRTWQAKTPAHHESGFLEQLRRTGIDDYVSAEGCIDFELWVRRDDSWTHYTLVSRWDSLDAVRSFAGDDHAVAVLYPGDEEYELVPERFVRHFEVVAIGEAE